MTPKSTADEAAATTPPRTFTVDNPMPHRLPEGENAAPLEVIGQTSSSSDKLVIVMVGLPATGTNTHILHFRPGMTRDCIF